jgi:cation diffusion facilitator family transporter
MASRESLNVVYKATIANVAIVTCKFIAAAVTRSSAMLAEAIHSTVDTGNELLMLLGMKRASRPPDELHPFGYGKAVYFWSLMVAVLIFGLGGGFSIFDGISRIMRSEPVTHPIWNYVVLGVSAAFEAYSWAVSRKQLMQGSRPGESVWRVIQRSKDPVVFTVFLEDSAALLGIALAFFGILLSQVTGIPYFDPAASIAIGLVLAGVALVLTRETGGLLVGERASRELVGKIKDVIAGQPEVEAVGDVLTMQLGPEQIFLAADIRFREGQNVRQLEAAIDQLENKIREVDPAIQRIFLEAESVRAAAERRPIKKTA